MKHDRIDLKDLEWRLGAIAKELIQLGTPFAVRRKIKDALSVLPAIEQARQSTRRRNQPPTSPKGDLP